jgi:hypothetical protein
LEQRIEEKGDLEVIDQFFAPIENIVLHGDDIDDEEVFMTV